MRSAKIIIGVAFVCAAWLGHAELPGSTTLNPSEKRSETCDVPDGIMCMAEKVAASDRGLDHTDALGLSGAAFRIHALLREVLCPSTVSPRFGFRPPAVDENSCDPATPLRQAKMLAEAGEFGEYVSGQAAYDLWIQLLEAEDESELMQEQMKAHSVEDAGLPILNTYCFLSLLHARQAAGPFLHRRAAELDGAAAQRVEEAAYYYERVAEVLETVGTPAWAPEARKRQAVAMQEAQDLEEQAAAQLGEALGLLNQEGSEQTPPGDAPEATQE